MITDQPRPKIATVILAAGQSKRMKAVKQLLPWKDTSLLGYAIKQSLQTESDAIFVVLGANKELILSSVDTAETTVIVNTEWSDGMGASIAAAVRYFELKKLDYDGVLIRLVDQPLLPIKHYNKLIDSYIKTKLIMATSYRSGCGVPVVFDNKFFHELLELKSDKGAREIINKNNKHVKIIDSMGKTVDLDDYETYLTYFNEHGK